MKRDVAPRESRRILSRVPLNVGFWLCTNEQLRNLDELGQSLQRVGDEVFRYHVNRDKNDFEVWIRDVIKDRELAREISRIKTKETLVRKISERVDKLRAVLKKAKSLAERARSMSARRKKSRSSKGRKKGRHTKKASRRKAARKGAGKRTSRTAPRARKTRRAKTWRARKYRGNKKVKGKRD